MCLSVQLTRLTAAGILQLHKMIHEMDQVEADHHLVGLPSCVLFERKSRWWVGFSSSMLCPYLSLNTLPKILVADDPENFHKADEHWLKLLHLLQLLLFRLPKYCEPCSVRGRSILKTNTTAADVKKNFCLLNGIKLFPIKWKVIRW